MRTQLSKFCTHFDRAVRPMLAPLQRSTEALGEAEQGTPGTSLRTELADLCHELESLLDKVAGQQAYVLIFGPLKSGKSTLMNAISKTYVSEVSSLPAYPCLVFVSHGEKREYVATEYGGRTRSYPDAKPLQDRIRTAHRELADRMRKTELSGAQFDPKEHFPSAIRRIDVKLPAANLAETGVVLVDTPGLYTRMRFGYDRMTREFRNMAACAVFVVKSDNLFLEQVFSEFHRLLELFSRVFLVVNMDTHKRDLGPDGALHPSLEQRAPERIIEAFESLAMSAPLAQATAEGRIRIYPVDLMNSASAVLRKDAEIPQSFVRFRDDLEQYLASTECLADFLGDSLRRAHSLSLEAGHLTDTEEAAALRDSVADLEARCNSCRGELDRIETCLRRQWKRAFARFAHELEREVQRRSHDQGAKLARVMDAAIDTWFMSNYSLDWLIAEEWAAMVQDFREDVLRTAQQCFEHSCSLELAGLDLEPADVSLLGSLGIDLRELRWAAHAQLGATAAPTGRPVPFDWREVPIRRGIVDMIMFRSVDSVRGRLFGTGGRPDRKLHSRTKKSRLGEPSKQFMRKALMRFRKALFRRTVQDTLARFREELQQATIAELHRSIKAREGDLRAALVQHEGELRRQHAVLDPLEELRTRSADVATRVHALTVQFAKIDPEVLLQPVERKPAQEASAESEADPTRRDRRRSEREQEA